MAIDDNERPPYVVFEMRGVEDRVASIAAGHHVEKDVAYAMITRPGSRDTLDMVAKEWLESLAAKAKQGTIPQTWPIAFKQAFEQWEKGETGEVAGTPIKNWPVIGPAARKTIIAAGILSVEDLAAMPDNELGTVGTGALAYKLKAKAWLDQANGLGKQVEKITALEVKLAELVDLTKKQATEIDALRKQVPQTAKA